MHTHFSAEPMPNRKNMLHMENQVGQMLASLPETALHSSVGRIYWNSPTFSLADPLVQKVVENITELNYCNACCMPHSLIRNHNVKLWIMCASGQFQTKKKCTATAPQGSVTRHIDSESCLSVSTHNTYVPTFSLATLFQVSSVIFAPLCNNESLDGVIAAMDDVKTTRVTVLVLSTAAVLAVVGARNKLWGHTVHCDVIQGE